MSVLPIVLYVYLGIGVTCALVLTIAVLPRVWGECSEEMWVAALAVACVPAWPLMVGLTMAIQSGYVTELLKQDKGE